MQERGGAHSKTHRKGLRTVIGLKTTGMDRVGSRNGSSYGLNRFKRVYRQETGSNLISNLSFSL
jgi:hypothetical protein